MKKRIGFFLSLTFIAASPKIWGAAGPSSETIEGQKGLFRLLSADINEPGDYHFRTSIQYFTQDDFLKDAQNSNVHNTRAIMAFGYPLTPNIHLSVEGGVNIASRKPTAAVGGTVPGSETIDLILGGAAITGTYDLGKFFNLHPKRFLGGLSVWMDFSKLSRFLKAVNIIPKLILTGDFTDNPVVPYRIHLNAGFRPANGARFYNSDTPVTDFGRFATDTINSYAILGGVGFEFPFPMINPSLEFHMEKVQNLSMSRSPMWITPGLKGRPFPQKNIEIFAAVDVGGLNTFHATDINSKPEAGPVPLWNVIVGFGVSQFGKKAGEVGVNEAEYQSMQKDLEGKDRTLAALKKDLEYNTVQGRVIDADTKKPLSGVILSFPENSDLKPSTTDSNGRFVRYFRSLTGARLLFSLDGYESSSKFLALKPSERVVVDISLKRSTGEASAGFVGTITDAQGRGVTATLTFTNLKTGENIVATSDASGQVTVKLPEGSYKLQVQAQGFQSINERVDAERGKTVLRSYTMTP